MFYATTSVRREMTFFVMTSGIYFICILEDSKVQGKMKNETHVPMSHKEMIMSLAHNKVVNVLHVVSRLPVGGVENMLLKIINAYDKNRFHASVCCIMEGGEIADELKRAGYKVEILDKMKRHGFDPGAVHALYRLMKRENIHILRTHQYHANLYGRIAGKLSGVPIIIPSFHNLSEYPHKPRLHKRAFNYFLGSFSDALVAVSNAVASDMIRFDRVNPEKIKLVYNGVPIERYNSSMSRVEARRIHGLPLHGILTGSVGRLTEQKGHRYLIEAFSSLNDKSLVIAGDGHLRNKLQELANHLKVACEFTGTVSPEKIPSFLRALDIFCFPSLWEGFGTALVEAMAAGLPVVASDIPPHREVLGDAGIFVPPGDNDAIEKAIKRLINDSSLREALGKKAGERAKLFTIENAVKTYENLFEDILKKKKLYDPA